jgi:hypothetical protein
VRGALFFAEAGTQAGLSGADRTHTDNEYTVLTLLSLALLLRTAFVVANERIKHGLMSPDLPPALSESLRQAA